MSHLTVNRVRTKPPETLEELVNTDGWRWCYEPLMLTGVPLEYFSRHTDPVVKKIYNDWEVTPIDDALKKVLSGGYSLISLNYYVTHHIMSFYANDQDRTPYYISKNNIKIMAYYGWGFRLGAPFHEYFNKLTMQIEAAGISTYWMQDVMEKRIKENRAKAKISRTSKIEGIIEDEIGQVVLGLDHMQGAFYMLILGTIISTFAILGEILLRYYPVLMVDGADPELFEEDFKDLSSFITVKCCKEIDTTDAFKARNFRKFKMNQWWAENKLCGIPRVVVGFRTEEGQIYRLENYDTDKLPTLAEGLWEPRVSLNILTSFLAFVKKKVMEAPEAVHRFERQSQIVIRTLLYLVLEEKLRDLSRCCQIGTGSSYSLHQTKSS
ncbi:hypothetical protein Pmani_021938 [Petrolisthes manimaculis]|uniref:Decapping nuclease n=1 Tax=Petrolisthes manimaculis TaxID=1843537 RepID=A0AAE1PDV7_9EUCA|nr:hypothetical protein Pmani_021938 [Petrolisthes manimaculis]